MEIATLNTLFNYVGIFAAILVVISTIGTFWTGKIIDTQKDSNVQLLQKQLSDLKPSVFSQTTESINVPENSLYKQSFKVSVDAPAANGIVVTHLTSQAIRVGKTEVSPIGPAGVRVRNEVLVPFQDYIYSFKTGKPLDMQTDSISFSYQANEGESQTPPPKAVA